MATSTLLPMCAYGNDVAHNYNLPVDRQRIRFSAGIAGIIFLSGRYCHVVLGYSLHVYVTALS